MPTDTSIGASRPPLINTQPLPTTLPKMSLNSSGLLPIMRGPEMASEALLIVPLESVYPSWPVDSSRCGRYLECFASTCVPATTPSRASGCIRTLFPRPKLQREAAWPSLFCRQDCRTSWWIGENGPAINSAPSARNMLLRRGAPAYRPYPDTDGLYNSTFI